MPMLSTRLLKFIGGEGMSFLKEAPESMSALARFGRGTANVAASVVLLPVAGAAMALRRPIPLFIAGGGAAALMVHQHNKNAANVEAPGLPPELAESANALARNQAQLDAVIAGMQTGQVASQPTALAPESQIAVTGPVVQATPIAGVQAVPTSQISASVPQGTIAPPSLQPVPVHA